MFDKFFSKKKALDRQLLDIPTLISQRPSDDICQELEFLLDEWRTIGLADIQLSELQGMSYLLTAMNRGVHWDASQIKLLEGTWKELFFHLIRTLIAAEYVPGHAEVKTQINNGSITTQYYAYLKPSIKYRARNPVMQLYGNMYIQLDIINDRTRELKIVSNVYAGRGYVPPIPFEEFIEKIYSDYKGRKG